MLEASGIGRGARREPQRSRVLTTAGPTPMDRVLRALLHTELRFFIQKVFATVSPGETYLHNWHVEAIAHQLMRVHSGESRRLLISQPPRSLKSICVSVAYVAWLLGHDPTRRVIVASYSGDFAAELHRQFRMVIASEWYAAVFPNLHLAKETGLEFVTSQGGSRYATSVGGTLTGRGADLIIVDDPLNANEVQTRRTWTDLHASRPALLRGGPRDRGGM
jgi:hypothetical protein